MNYRKLKPTDTLDGSIFLGDWQLIEPTNATAIATFCFRCKFIALLIEEATFIYRNRWKNKF
jgi:hypothetical protein